MIKIFESKVRRARDAMEVRYVFSRYGENAPEVLKERAQDSSLSQRERRHWKRLARKAQAGKRRYLDKRQTQLRTGI